MSPRTLRLSDPLDHVTHLLLNRPWPRPPLLEKLAMHLVVQLLVFGFLTDMYGWFYALVRFWTSDSDLLYLAFIGSLGGLLYVEQELPRGPAWVPWLGKLSVVAGGCLIALLLLWLDGALFFRFHQLNWTDIDQRAFLLRECGHVLLALSVGEGLWLLRARWRLAVLVVGGIALLTLGAWYQSGRVELPLRQAFKGQEVQGVVDDERLDEASGLQASRSQPGYLWTHNDGDIQYLYLLDENAHVQARWKLPPLPVQDVEDIAAWTHPQTGQTWLYLADIGNNHAYYPDLAIYRFPEPQELPPGSLGPAQLSGVEMFRYRYPDGPRDAEACFVDPATGAIYLISKREARSRIYRAPAPRAGQGPQTLNYVGALPFHGVVAADLSPDGREALVKTYRHIYYWKRKPGESLEDMLLRQPVELPYIPEPQGEAIAWGSDRDRFFTLSEKNQGIPPHLYRYQRSLPPSGGAATE